ncbi:YceI family protein [Pontibacter sp. E15-1]|uniref:YceI family protein n=1 Tax=Pontibacter sp. E15-1 TaxID=2919918 RepID=UPI001F4F463F|nr:YceI family protein [Pontibacter sp. E15-1]MCJ8164184.1 YceI family protein [Pontibacter sp. E15-1]
MKNCPAFLGTLALATLLCTPPATAAETPTTSDATEVRAASTLAVNTAESSMTWNAKKFGGAHTGTVKLASGTLAVNGNKLVGGSFAIDMASIDNTDITNADFNKKLTDHLKSEDFFSVEKHPTSTFKITKVQPVANAKAGEANYTLTGDLTIKGITNPVTFPAVVRIDGKSAVATAQIALDRTKWDVKYRSGLLGTAADKVIDDEFNVDLRLVAGTDSQTAETKMK